MYRFSRSIYRELSPGVIADCRGTVEANRRQVLKACEKAIERLATDRHYFARPTRTLFNDIRDYFPIQAQLRVYQVIQRHMTLAGEYVDQHAQEGVSFDGSPLCCHATTRKGTACQRVPLPGSQYCPSHQHLDERYADPVLEQATAA